MEVTQGSLSGTRRPFLQTLRRVILLCARLDACSSKPSPTNAESSNSGISNAGRSNAGSSAPRPLCIPFGDVELRNVKYHEPEFWKFGEEANKYFRHAPG